MTVCDCLYDGLACGRVEIDRLRRAVADLPIQPRSMRHKLWKGPLHIPEEGFSRIGFLCRFRWCRRRFV